VTLVGATPAKLLERLTLHGAQSVDALLRVFLTVYRHYLSPRELLELLVARFRSPQLLSAFDDKEAQRFFATHVLAPFHARVLRILELWATQCPADFLDDGGGDGAELRRLLQSFLSDTVLPLGAPPSFLPGPVSHYKSGAHAPLCAPRVAPSAHVCACRV